VGSVKGVRAEEAGATKAIQSAGELAGSGDTVETRNEGDDMV